MLSILNVQPVIKTQRIISPIIDSSTKGNCSILSLVCVKGKKKAQCLNASKLFSFFFCPSCVDPEHLNSKKVPFVHHIEIRFYIDRRGLGTPKGQLISFITVSLPPLSTSGQPPTHQIKRILYMFTLTNFITNWTYKSISQFQSRNLKFKNKNCNTIVNLVKSIQFADFFILFSILFLV